MRGLTSTIALVVVLAGLGAYIYFVDSKRPEPSVDGGAPKSKVFTVEPDKINELRITAKGETSLLRKGDSGWKLVEPAAVDADPPEVIAIAQALSSLESEREVVDNPSDLKQFGLAEPAISIEFKAEGGASGSLKFGNKNATQGEIYALKGGDDTVFLISAFQESTFQKAPFDLRDKKVLKFDREKADALTIAKGTDGITLSRDGSDWKVLKPATGRSDYSAVEGFLTRLSSANMSRLVDEQAGDLGKYGLDKPSMAVTVGAGSTKAVLEIGKTDAGETFARDAARSMVFVIDSTLQTELNNNFDVFHKKELFEFRPFSVARLRAVLDSPGGQKIYEFEKGPAAKPGDADIWKVTREGGASFTADATAMDDLLNKLIALKAESFVTASNKTGLDKPALVVSASYDEGKFERVRFGAAGVNSFGRRDGEEVIAKVEDASMRAALQAFDAVTVVPAADPKAGDKK
jgi:hypothetical protein